MPREVCFPEEKKMESENFQGSGPLLDPRGLAVFIAPLSYGSYGSHFEAAPSRDGAPLFCCPFCPLIHFFCQFFLSPLSSNLTPPMEDLGVASVVATVLYARGLTQRVLSCDKSVNIEGYSFIDVCQSVNDGSHF